MRITPLLVRLVSSTRATLAAGIGKLHAAQTAEQKRPHGRVHHPANPWEAELSRYQTIPDPGKLSNTARQPPRPYNDGDYEQAPVNGCGLPKSHLYLDGSSNPQASASEAESHRFDLPAMAAGLTCSVVPETGAGQQTWSLASR